MASATPDLQIPSQPPGITAHWLVPNYTPWWQRLTCVNNLPRVALDSGVAGIWTHDLLIASLAPYRYATEPQVEDIKPKIAWKEIDKDLRSLHINIEDILTRWFMVNFGIVLYFLLSKFYMVADKIWDIELKSRNLFRSKYTPPKTSCRTKCNWCAAGAAPGSISEPFYIVHSHYEASEVCRARNGTHLVYGSGFGHLPFLAPPVNHSGASKNRTQFAG